MKTQPMIIIDRRQRPRYGVFAEIENLTYSVPKEERHLSGLFYGASTSHTPSTLLGRRPTLLIGLMYSLIPRSNN